MSVRHVVASNVLGGLGSTAERVPVLRHSIRAGLTVFLFHDVTDRPSEYQRRTDSFTSTSSFVRQIDWIARHLHVVRPIDLVSGRPIEPGSALITFDDAWRGVATTALPLLEERGLPAVLFLNMGTVAGAPDLSAVEDYERTAVAPGRGVLPQLPRVGIALIEAIVERYGDDASFRAFEGAMLRPADLEGLRSESVAFGSHLYNHWRSSELTDEDFATSFRQNEAALGAYPNHVPLFAFPFGARSRDFRDGQVPIALASGAARVFTAHGGQNGDPSAPVLDRVWFTERMRSDRALWYRTHGDRFRRRR